MFRKWARACRLFSLASCFVDVTSTMGHCCEGFEFYEVDVGMYTFDVQHPAHLAGLQSTNDAPHAPVPVTVLIGSMAIVLRICTPMVWWSGFG